jgi:hypothetical protein
VNFDGWIEYSRRFEALDRNTEIPQSWFPHEDNKIKLFGTVAALSTAKFQEKPSKPPP